MSCKLQCQQSTAGSKTRTALFLENLVSFKLFKRASSCVNNKRMIPFTSSSRSAWLAAKDELTDPEV